MFIMLILLVAGGLQHFFFHHPDRWCRMVISDIFQDNKGMYAAVCVLNIFLAFIRFRVQ